MVSMNKKIFIFIILYCSAIIAQINDNDFGYKNWPSKRGVVKHRIEIPVTPFLGYGLQLTPTFNDSIVRFKIPMSENDTVKLGRLLMQIYPTIEKAQLALRDYLYTFQSTIKPPRLESENFSYGDVAFGWEINGTYRVYFCDNNIMLIIEAATDITPELIAKTESVIQSAPNWSPGDVKPAFILSEQLIHTFFVENP